MKILKTLLVFIAIILLSAFLAPFIYKIAPFKFERILSRLVMVFSLLTIVFFARIRMRDLEKYGFSAGDNWFLLLRQGFTAGFLTLALLTALEVLMGGRIVAANLDPWWHMLLRVAEYIFASLLIGFTEELFFRGFLFTRIRMKCPVGLSFGAANLVYAALHFFKGGTYPVPANPGFMDGLKVVAHLADPFLNPVSMWPTFLGLFLFGSLLTYAFLKTGSLFLSIGLHAGSVFFLKVDNWFIASVPQASPLLFGDKNLHSGLLGWIFISLLFLWISRRYRNS